jgi:hypothetical protein
MSLRVFRGIPSSSRLTLFGLILCSITATSQSTLSSSTLNFGNGPVGSSSLLQVTISNSGKTNLTVSQATVTGTGFSFAGPNLPLSLAPQQSVGLYVSFVPQVGGSASGTLTITTGTTIGNSGKVRSSSSTIALSGTGMLGYLSASPTAVSFGSMQVGSNHTQTVTLANSGAASLTISQDTLTGAGFSLSGLTLPATLAPGQSLTAAVVFAPTSSGTVNGTLTVASNASDTSLSVSLSGTGASAGQLTSNPSSLRFGNVPVGSSQTQNVTLTNSGGSNLTISQDTLTGAGFSLSRLTLPVTLAAGQSLTAAVVFAPASSGTVSGTLTIVSNASNASLGVGLSGSGSSSGQLSVAPIAMSFGSVTMGTAQSQTGTLSATGSSVTVSSGSSSSSQFTLSGLTLPLTIPAGQSVPFTVVFAPQVSGTLSANISFSSNASSSPTAETASGIGATLQHTVDLSWNASTSSPAGYNVYRGSASGGPYTKINLSLDAGNYYADGTVQSGQTYYYVTTAVDSSGTESGYSNQVTANVPMH